MGRLLRGTFKLGLIALAIGGLVFAAKKLMGGLGPQPGSDTAPKEWPSLVPEPVVAADAAKSSTGTNGNGSTATDETLAAEASKD